MYFNFFEACSHYKENERVSTEDVFVAECLKNHNIFPHDTRDQKLRERFFHFGYPGVALDWDPKIYESADVDEEWDWFVKYTNPYKVKPWPECCSPYPILFHYADSKMKKKLYTHFYLFQ